jgi:hypothetical protein
MPPDKRQPPLPARQNREDGSTQKRTAPPVPPPPPRRSEPSPKARGIGDQQRRLPGPPKPPADWHSSSDSKRDENLFSLPTPPLPPFRPRRQDVRYEEVRTIRIGGRQAPINRPIDDFLRGAPDPLREPPTQTRDRVEPSPPKESKYSDNLLNVSLICTQLDRAFVVRFREERSILGKQYKYESTLTDIDENGTAAPSMTVPVASLSWSGISCPHCRSKIRPIRCGSCGRLACDGRVTESANGTYFSCAPSCGRSGGLVTPGLITITGSGTRRTSLPVPANRPILAPPDPPAAVPRLPKPR